jgi:hypothetical protein
MIRDVSAVKRVEGAVSDGTRRPGFSSARGLPMVPPVVPIQIMINMRGSGGISSYPASGKKRHPLFIPAEFAGEILAYEGKSD